MYAGFGWLLPETDTHATPHPFPRGLCKVPNHSDRPLWYDEKNNFSCGSGNGKAPSTLTGSINSGCPAQRPEPDLVLQLANHRPTAQTNFEGRPDLFLLRAGSAHPRRPKQSKKKRRRTAQEQTAPLPISTLVNHHERLPPFHLHLSNRTSLRVNLQDGHP